MMIALFVWVVGALLSWPAMIAVARKKVVDTPLGSIHVGTEALNAGHVVGGFFAALIWPVILGIRLFHKVF